MTHPNDTPSFRPTADDMEQVFARSTEQREQQVHAQRRAAEWPGQVDRVVAALAGRAVTHDQKLAAIDARLAKLEAAMGLSAG